MVNDLLKSFLLKFVKLNTLAIVIVCFRANQY
jgi:hypothetical protein